MFETVFSSDWITNAMFNIFVKASVVLLVPLIINILHKKSAAEFRHLLLFIAILILILLPLLPGPILTFELPWFQQDWNRLDNHLLKTSTTISNSDFNSYNSTTTPNENSNTLTYLSMNNKPDIGHYLSFFTFFIWLTGSIYLITQLIIGICGVYQIKKALITFSDQEWVKTHKNCCWALKLNRPIQLFIGGKFQTPFTFGIIKPFIYLPESSKNWPAERRQSVLLHELSHIKRGDTLTHLIARFVVALYWLNPLIWAALRLLRLEQEGACDDRVLNYGIKPSDYASHLLNFLKERRPAHPFAALGVSSFKTIKSRIGQILNPIKRRSLLNIRMCITAITIVVLLVFTVAIFGPVTTAMEGSLSLSNSKQVEHLQPEPTDKPILITSKTKINHQDTPITTSPKVSIQSKTDVTSVSASDIPSLMPINADITAPFGMRYHEKFKEERMHTGIDIEAKIGTPVQAAANGRVLKAKFAGGYGLMVEIAHKKEIFTIYAHLSSLSVKPEQTILQGDILGYSGNTGQTTGPHLHYEVRVKDQPVNPLIYINQDNTQVNPDNEKSISHSQENLTASYPNFMKPVPFNKITSPFGLRIDPITKISHFHSGIDISLSIGTPVKASAGGKVIKAQSSGSYGILVIIEHQDNYSTYYAKLSQALVKVGDIVKQGDIIAYSGNTGRSTGPHLHFEVRDQDRPVDPMLFLR